MAAHRSLEDSDLALIARVKMTPSLYDPRNPDFRLAYRKEQEWEVVGATVGMSATEARRRWTCLRDRYSRELKQLRLHPDKKEFGNNPFFRQMDFLRRYVRKRRTRRRNGYIEYESQSADDSRMTKATHNIQLQHKSSADMTEAEEEEEYNLQSYDDGHSNTYTGKIDEEGTMESDDYPEFVGVAAGEVYEECVETPMNEEHIKSNQSSQSISVKQLSNTAIPIIAQQQQQHNTNHSVYTLTAANQPHHHMSTTAGAVNHTQLAPRPMQMHLQSTPHFNSYQNVGPAADTEDDLFGKSIAVYLRQLSRRHKIKAQVEMFQILEKYIELEESAKVAAPGSTNYK